MKRHIKRLAVLALTFVSLTLVSVASSQSGSGVVIEGNPVGTDGIGSLNPLLCNNPYCRRIVDFLFPKLYAVDPATGLVTGAAPGNYGLVVDVTAPTETVQQITLRDDLVWSDGTSVTAYDVFYSYLAIINLYVDSSYAAVSTLIRAVRVIDAHTIEFAYTTADCTIPARHNFSILPAHVFDPSFQEIVDGFGAEGEITEWYDTWIEAYPQQNFAVMSGHPFNAEPTVTAGEFRLAEILPGEEIRLVTPDGETAFIYRDVQPGMTETQFFLEGGSNILVNPPYDVRADLLANPELQISQIPGTIWDFIAFNLANPSLPRSAFTGDGTPLQQGQHPLFGDLRVRQAIQMGIDVPTLIEASLGGYGVPLASSRVPGTWAHNDALQPSTYNPRGAERLLDEAGWIDRDEDGVRECHGCLYATEGRGLFLTMMVMSDGTREIAANLIAQQLRSLGVWVEVQVMDSGTVLSEARNQQFDAYMGGFSQRYPYEPDQTGLFSRESDVLYTGGNTGSYASPQVDELMTQARTLPGCNPDARTDIYRDIQATLQADLPYIWLYAAQDMVVGRGLDGLAPYPNRPFWNILDWNVVAS